MVKEDCPGKMLVVAALLLALGMIIGSYLLAQGDYAPKMNVSDITSMPNVYVSSSAPDHDISVSATVSESVAPDLLVVQLSVETQEDTAQESQERNADVSAELMDQLELLGIPEEDIQSASYRVDVVRESQKECDEYGCDYDYVIVGYKTTHVLLLDLEELDKGGEVIDAAAGVGTNEVFVDYIDFTLKDETRDELEKSLLKTASEEAKEKAENIAAGLGVTLGNAISASESIYYPYYDGYYKSYARMDYAAEPALATTELSPGEVEASATVSVSFEIQ